MKILIPNGTSPQNIGDQAMLEALMLLIGESSKDVVLHTYSPKLLEGFPVKEIKHTLYSWTAFQNRSYIIRIIRVFLYIYSLLCIKLGLRGCTFGKYRKLIKDYFESDVIIFAAGGYLRSKQGITQSLNILMLLSMFWIATKTKAVKILAPNSFAPFAYNWQKNLAVRLLNKFDLVMAREHYSYEVLEKERVKNLVLTSDIALLHEKVLRSPNSEPVLGFTIRKWLPEKEQRELERSYIEAIHSFSKENKYKVRPIVQVDAPEYGDYDKDITENIAKILTQRGVSVLPLQTVKSVSNAFDIYGGVDMVIGMRMHSNILAATQHTPFVAVSYEHKTEGISNQLGMVDYVVRVEEVNPELLLEKIIKLKDKLGEASQNLSEQTVKIRLDVNEIWRTEVRKLISTP